MSVDAAVIDSVHLLMRNGTYTVPADSGIGDVYRPKAVGQDGGRGRVATPETLFDNFINVVPDPDEAFQLNPNIEQQIRMHPMVAANFNKRSFTVSSMPWRVEPNPRAENKHAASLIADYCTDVLAKIPNFEQCIEIMEYAVIAGGQGLEFVWHQDANGVEYPVAWHPVHKSRFSWDRLGNLALLTRDQAVWGAYVAMNPQEQHQNFKGPLPQGKFIYHIYKKGQGTWYRPALEGYSYIGQGEDVAIYYVLTFDIFCLKYRMKFLEKYALPPSRLYFPSNMATSRDTQRIMDSIRGESLVTIPFVPFGGTGNGTTDHNNMYKLEDLPTPKGSFDYFDSHTNGYTKPCLKAILLGDDSGDKEESKGGYSSDVSKRDAGPNVFFRRDAKIIGSTFTTQLMPSIATGRFPNITSDLYPIFSLESKEEKDRMQELQIIEQAQKSGLQITEQHAYDAADLPIPKPGDKLLAAPQQQLNPAAAMQGGMPGIPPKQNGNGRVQFGLPGIGGERQGVGQAGGQGSIGEN